MSDRQTYGEGTVAITRVFDAPRVLAWQAWTDSKMLAQWFGPRGFTTSVPVLDLCVGGALRIVMHGPDATTIRRRANSVRSSRRSGWSSSTTQSTRTTTCCSKG